MAVCETKSATKQKLEISNWVFQEEVMNTRRGLTVVIATLAWLVLSLSGSFTASSSGHSAPPDQRRVVVTVRIIDDGGNKISGAHISVYQGEQFLGQGESDVRGVAQIDVVVNTEKAVVLALEVSKPGMQTNEYSLKLGTNFPLRPPIADIELKPGASRSEVVLTVKVADSEGHAVQGARVNVYKGSLDSSVFASPPVTGDFTNANGAVTFTLPLRAGEVPDIRLAVSREDMVDQRRSLDLQAGFPTILPPVTFTLMPRGEVGSSMPTVNIKVNVEDDAGNNLEGALVAVTSDALTPSQRNKPHQKNTGPDGSATVGIELMSADPVENIGITVSKPGYKEFTRVEPVNNRGGKAVGKTIEIAPISLVRLPDATFEVRITVLDGQTNRGIPDAEIVLDGPDYATRTTDGNGVATLPVDKPGSYKVRISQDYYEKVNDVEVRLIPQDKHPDVPAFRLRAKPKKDSAGDTIDITVLAKDSIDADSKTHPVPKAAVSDGRGTTYTDENGRAQLKGAYEGSQQITVTAKDYQPLTRRVGIGKLFPLSQGTGSATFILDPALSNKSSIRLVVEVHDAAPPQNTLSQAFVYLYFVGPNNKETHLATARSNENGEASFTLEDNDNLPLSKLRSGLRIYGKTNRHKLTPSDVIADQLLPSLEVRRITIFLERDWDALVREIAALEAKVNAWKNGPAVNPAERQRFIDKANSELQDAQALFIEIDAAARTFPEATSFGTESICSRASALLLDIRSCETLVNQKAEELQKTLKDASDRAPRCSSPAEAESLRASYRKSIQLLAEIGKLKKQAIKDHDELELVVAKSGAGPRLLSQMKSKADQLSTLADAAGQNEFVAAAYYRRIADATRTVVTTQLTLKAELATLTVKVEAEAGVPPELMKRLTVMERLLAGANEGMQPAQPLPAAVSSARGDITQLQNKAAAMISKLDGSVCTNIPTLDEVVSRIDNRFSDSSLDIGFANDIPKLADACAARTARSANTSTGPDKTENKPDDKISASSGPGKEKKPATEDDSEIKIAQPGKPGSQDTSSGGFWEAAKAGKKDVENKVTSKPAKPANNTSAAGDNSENKQTSSTAVSKSPGKSTRPSSGGGNNSDNQTGAKRPETNPSTDVEEIPETAVKPAAARGSAETQQASSTQKKPKDPNKPSKWQKAGAILGAIAAATNNQNQGTNYPGATKTDTTNTGTTNTGATTTGTNGVGSGSEKEWMIRNAYHLDSIQIAVRGGQVIWTDRAKREIPARQGCVRDPAPFSGSFDGKNIALDWTMTAEFCPSVGKYYSTSVRETCALQLNSDNSLSGNCTVYPTDWSSDRRSLVPKPPTTEKADGICIKCQ